MVRRSPGAADILGISIRDQGFRRGGRDIKGRFTNFQGVVQAANQKNAQYVQSLVVENFLSSVRDTGRPQRESEYLYNAIRAGQFIRSNIDGFVVNPKGYLDSGKAAPYWRNLEKGTTRFVGRKVQGFFLSREGRASGPMSSRIRQDVRMIQTAAVYENHVPTGKHAGAGFVETKTVMQIGGAAGSLGAGTSRSRIEGGRAHRVVQNNQTSRKHPKPHWDIRIKNPIRPHHYLDAAFREAFESGVFEENWTEALRQAGIVATVKRVR